MCQHCKIECKGGEERAFESFVREESAYCQPGLVHQVKSHIRYGTEETCSVYKDDKTETKGLKLSVVTLKALQFVYLFRDFFFFYYLNFLVGLSMFRF